MAGSDRWRFSWRTRAENPLNVWVFASVHPAILLAEFSVTTRETFQSQLVAMAFTWYGLLTSLLLFLGLRQLLNRLGLIRKGLWIVLVPFGAFIGLSADLATLVYEGASLQQMFAGFPEEHYFAMFLGAVLAFASAQFETLRQEYTSTRQMIIAEKVRKATTDVPARSQILSSFIEGAKRRLREDSAGADVGQFAAELRGFVNDELRPLSHSLWEREERQQRRFSIRFLALRVIARPIQYPILVAGFGVGAATRSVLSRDASTGYLQLIAMLVSITAALWLVNVAHQRKWIPQPIARFSLILSAMFAGAVVTLVVPFFPAYDERTVLVRYWLLASLVILIAGVVTTFIFETRKLLSDQAKELRSVLDAGDLTDEQAKLLASIRARDAANYLHSTTQNRLLALVGRLETKQSNIGELSDSELGELEEILEDALAVRKQAASLRAGIAELVKSWEGLLEIEIDYPETLELTPIAEELAFLAIREAVSNSFRHGKASAVQVGISREPDTVLLEIADNGTGYRPGKSGLGSKIFNLAGDWRYVEKADSGTLLQIRI